MGSRFKADCQGSEVQEGVRATSQDPRPGSWARSDRLWSRFPEQEVFSSPEAGIHVRPKDEGHRKLGSMSKDDGGRNRSLGFPGRRVKAGVRGPRGTAELKITQRAAKVLGGGGGVRGRDRGRGQGSQLDVGSEFVEQDSLRWTRWAGSKFRERKGANKGRA